ncbi:hypothetical protein DCAR_0207951 [Daucus carota subsp. sativus]|uniref:RRM domain-containing protein n=1 Tax=Daucus carota subsp. sativus TaxID=79200 RepID=A0AAF0WG08_DAUCS|nr:hypothetical protein DCAR_0207951 [Daucus carota subsp. sativus]
MRRENLINRRKLDGKSRQFGFVGYRSENEAQQALKFFNNSYLDTGRITCETARKVGDPNMPLPWSQHSLKKQQKLLEEKKQTTAPKSLKVKNPEEENKDNQIDDPQLNEFIEVMLPRSKAKLWSNDTSTVAPLEQKKEASKKNIKGGKNKNTASKLDETDESEKSSDGEAVTGNLDPTQTASDMDYFRSKVKTEWSDSESDEEDRDNKHGVDEDIQREKNKKSDILEEDDSKEGNEEAKSDVTAEADHLDENEDFEAGRLFVRNLPYTATEDELEEHFSKFGNVSQVHVVVDKETKRSKGYAYILYTLPESANRALEELDNSTFQGRLMHVMRAKHKNPPVNQETNVPSDKSKTFKQKRVEERRESEASGNTKSWNTLFMRHDTVVENIARKLGISKSDLLDREASDLAVRVALGETQVIAETKKALVNAGVNVASLEEFASKKTDNMKRSNHVIIVKNLPYDSSEGELAEMFSKSGGLDKIIIPPTKTLALVIFLEPAEARSAFRRLSYKRYKDAPLYLEWAPANILNPTSASLSDANDSVIIEEQNAKRGFLEQHVNGTADMDIDPDRVESRSLFVKNLNFKTSDESLKKYFSEHVKEGRILSVRVKKHVKNGKNVSMGFGFVEFDSVDTATNVCKDLQGSVLDGHALILQRCHGKKDEQTLKKVQKDHSSTKLIVRNVAFEATEKELRQLFSPFGQIKSLRLPMKFGNHRGFAFVEYVTKKEAQSALEALSNTHLYGRHLVLERAKEGESLEELRARTEAQFTNEQNGFQNPTKLSKKRKSMAALDEGSFKFGRIVD